jgi:hypothetical protein
LTGLLRRFQPPLGGSQLRPEHPVQHLLAERRVLLYVDHHRARRRGGAFVGELLGHRPQNEPEIRGQVTGVGPVPTPPGVRSLPSGRRREVSGWCGRGR